MAALATRPSSGSSGPRLRKRFGIWLNLLARILLQQPPEPFIAQVGAILDAPDELRFELETSVSPRSSSPAPRTRSRPSATPRSSPS